MSSTGTTASATAASIISTAKAGIATNFATVVQELTADGFGLLGQEAEDFGNFIDTMVEDVETGMSWSAAWAKESAVLIAAEKSQLYQDAMAVLQQVATQFDSWLKAVEAII